LTDPAPSFTSFELIYSLKTNYRYAQVHSDDKQEATHR
jgi:hypothetical protein